MSLQLVLNGNDLYLIQNDKIIGVYEWYLADSMNTEIEVAICKALGKV